MKKKFRQLVTEVRACTLCEDDLADGVRPVLQVDERARILIAGQAPGSKVHRTGVPFDDPSGDRLREWMGIDKATFTTIVNSEVQVIFSFWRLPSTQ